MDEDIVASTKNIVLKTRAKSKEVALEQRIDGIDKKIDLLLSKFNERNNN